MLQIIERSRQRFSCLRRKILSRKNGILYFYVVLMLGSSVCGCRKQQWELTPIEGTVARAGKPLPGVQVVFLPDMAAGGRGPLASGYTNADGRYELRTDAGERGVVAGRYRVCLMAPSSEQMRLDKDLRSSARAAGHNQDDVGDGSKSPALDQVPQSYGSFDKTPLKVEVKPDGKQTFDFDVSGQPPKQ